MAHRTSSSSGGAAMNDCTNEILTSLVAATPERKAAALRALHGEVEVVEKAPDFEPYLTLREVARRLGISVCSLWRYGVPGHVLGGRRRFRMSEVGAYLGSKAFEQRSMDLQKARQAKASKQ